MISTLNPVVTKLRLRSESKSLLILESWVNFLCETHAISNEIYGNILIALSEAVNNAINHGNKNILEKETLIVSTFNHKHLTFNVTDMGNGFDFSDLPDPTLPENIEKPQGRGIFLMRQLSERVVFQEPGNNVELTFKV
tara:strand:- start:50 stop:466 length:417 start_codon:yes stop_codon:yes gene_type:complete